MSNMLDPIIELNRAIRPDQEAATEDALRVAVEVVLERLSQDEQWGGPSHDDGHGPGDWERFILYFLQLAPESRGLPGFAAGAHSQATATPHWRKRMKQMAALSLAAMQWYDRNYDPDEIVKYQPDLDVRTFTGEPTHELREWLGDTFIAFHAERHVLEIKILGRSLLLDAGDWVAKNHRTGAMYVGSAEQHPDDLMEKRETGGRDFLTSGSLEQGETLW